MRLGIAAKWLRLRSRQNKRPVWTIAKPAFFNLIPAATYVPTQLPAQYHRPNEA